MKKKLSTIFLFLALIAGLALLLYPSVSDYWNSFHQSRAIANYVESASKLDASVVKQMISDASAYNGSLLEKDLQFFNTEAETAVYDSLLNLSGDGIMGHIEVPKIGCSLPVYHGTSESVLQIAIGHIEGSSLPVGGASTHCVLSGHRGLPSAKLFSELDKLNEGDIFTIQILNEVLTYEVDQIHIVLPNEMDDLAIVPGRDYCTLVTCTPYGVNTHRLLVRGHRIENITSLSAARITAEAMRIDPIIVAPMAAIPMLVLLMIWMTASTSKKPNKARKKK